MTHRLTIIITALLGYSALIALPACSPTTCPPWRPPVVVAMPTPPTLPPAKKKPTAGQRTCRDWSDVRGGPLRRGRSFCPGLRRPPAVRWQFDTGAAVIAPPIVRGKWIYVGSTNGRLFALNRATGKPRWTFEAGNTIHAAVALRGRALLLGTDDGQLRRLDADSGRVRWTYRSSQGIDHAPAVYKNVVLLSTRDGVLTALDLRTGLFRWQFVTATAWRPSVKGGYHLAGIGGPPARSGNTIFFGSLGGQVHALDVTTGHLRWGIQTGWPMRSPPVVASKGLWVSDGSGYVHTLSRENGDRTGGMRSWYEKDISAPTLGDTGPFVATNNALLSLTPMGRVRWRHRVPWTGARLRGGAHPAPVLAGDVVYLNDRYGQLWAMDATTGRLLWQRLAKRGAFTAPAPLREGLVVGSGDGWVYRLGPGKSSPASSALK